MHAGRFWIGYCASMAIVLAALACSEAKAEEPWAVASLGSHHFSDDHFNQRNLGFGFEYPTSRRRLAAVGGAYDNSFERTSVYGGVAWTPLGVGGVAWLGFVAGAITGYGHPVLPLILPTVQFEHRRVGLNVFYAPRIKDGASVLGFQAKVRF